MPVPVFDSNGNELPSHAKHFKDASIEATTDITPALNSLIAGNVSSFPLSSTSVGVSFDFSTGQPVSIVESLGPIFAETGRTLGKGKINAGINYTHLGLSTFRGLKAEDMRFTFTHEDVGVQGLGDNPNESDILNIQLGLDVDASIFAFFATMGVTEKLDIGVAVPMVNIDMKGDAIATINSFTFANLGKANHMFIGGDTLRPILGETFDYNETASGIGDLTVRLKYSFLSGAGANLAALLDVRLPTGDETDFLGTGETNVRLVGILSKKFGDFTPHLNLGYDYRGAELDSDEFEFAAGFDQKLLSGLTFALDILGEVNLNEEETISLFPGEITITDQIENNGKPGEYKRTVSKSNIPHFDKNDNLIRDNIFNAALGLRYAPSERVILLGNILVPLNDGGLRSDVAATFGLAVSI